MFLTNKHTKRRDFVNDYDKYQSEDQTNRVNSGIALNRNTNDVLGSIFYDCTKK